MVIRQKNIIWDVLMVALVAALFSACQKDQSSSEDEEAWIVKNYFLPSSDRATIESSFKLCGTNNEHSIENLTLIYSSKNLIRTIDDLSIYIIEGSCSDCKDDPRQNYIIEAIEKWYIENDSGKMNPSKLAYEYALFQHWLYLKYPEKIRDEKIRALYKMARSNSIDGCLKSRIVNGTRLGLRPKNKEELQKERAASDEGPNVDWYIFASVLLLFLFEWRRSFIDIRRAGRYVFGQFKNAGAPVYQTPVADAGVERRIPVVATAKDSKSPEKFTDEPSANSTSARTPQHQYGNSSTKESPKALHEKLQQQLKEPPSSNTTTPHQIVPREQPKETKPGTPTPTPSPEPKKEVILEKQIHIPTPPEPKKQQPVPSVIIYGSSVLFARMPSGNTFHKVEKTFESNETFFALTISLDDPKTASVSLTTDLETREYFLTHWCTHQNVCEFRGVENPAVKNVKELEPGSAKLTNDYWTLKTSIKLEWQP